MADDSDLDYIRYFLGLVHTTATVNHIGEIGRMMDINDTSRIFVYPGEILDVEMNTGIVRKRYAIDIYEVTEALLETAIINIVAGLDNMNTRTTIVDFTKPASMYCGKFVSSNKPYMNGTTKHWTCKLIIDFEWVN